MTTAIIGYGWVGKSVQKLFPKSIVYDVSIFNSSKRLVNECDVAFISVPTPLKDGKLDTSIVEEVIKWCECPLLIVRSTVNPGDCGLWTIKYDKHIVFIPEYLGETPSHPMLDPKTRPFLIIGGSKLDRRKAIELYTQTYNANITIRQVTLYEAEIIKLSENRAIAFKVAECHELYEACQRADVDYYTIRDAVYGDDPRFNLWWTFIYENKLGFNSKCLPKDVYAWLAWAESAPITKAILERNEQWLKLAS